MDVPAEGKIRAATTSAPSEAAPSESLLQFHELMLKREQLRTRRLLRVFAAVLVLLLATQGWLAYRLSALEPAATPSVTPAELQALRAELRDLQAAVRREARETEDLGRRNAELNRAGRGRVTKLARCVDRALASLENAMTRLVARKMSPEAFVSGYDVPRCRR